MVVEKTVRNTERFFDNHYKLRSIAGDETQLAGLNQGFDAAPGIEFAVGVLQMGLDGLITQNCCYKNKYSIASSKMPFDLLVVFKPGALHPVQPQRLTHLNALTQCMVPYKKM